jgi:hypothetical protein
MLRVLADNWGQDPKVWPGRKVELYGDPEVYFGKEKRGGTRISRLSHISGPKKTLINPRGGRGAYWSVKPLPDAPKQAPQPPRDFLAEAEQAEGDRDLLRALWKAAKDAGEPEAHLKTIAALAAPTTEESN